MNEIEGLPEGITINKGNVDFSYEVEYEIIKTIKCDKCDISYDAFLLTNGNRHEGKIVVNPSNSITWKNTLSKDKNKAIKNLLENLQLRIDRHKERCNNDQVQYTTR